MNAGFLEDLNKFRAMLNNFFSRYKNSPTMNVGFRGDLNKFRTMLNNFFSRYKNSPTVTMFNDSQNPLLAERSGLDATDSIA